MLKYSASNANIKQSAIPTLNASFVMKNSYDQLQIANISTDKHASFHHLRTNVS